MSNQKRAVPTPMRQDVKRAPLPAADHARFAHLAGADLSPWHEQLQVQAVQEEDAAAQSVIAAMGAGRSRIER